MPDPGPEDLRAGYRHLRGKGVAAYAGVLRSGEGRVPDWACLHTHMTPPSALRCAQGELDRRRQGAREVLTLLHCGPCATWTAPASPHMPPGNLVSGLCPRCGVPMAAERVFILEQEAKV